MHPDLEKIQYHTGYNAFKNNREYTGTLSLSGSTSPGTTIKTFTVTLAQQPDMLSIMFNGASDTHWEVPSIFDPDPRLDNEWFRKGAIWVRGDNPGVGYTDYPTNWYLGYLINGLTVTITAMFVQSFTDPLTLTATPFSYKIVDYSIF